MASSSIEWTDKVWNPVRGCVKVSPGCKNCYAETFAERWRGVPGHAYEQGFDLRLVPEKLEEPLRWQKPARVFVNSMSDLFQEGVPWYFIDDVFEVMAEAPRHTFQILTKRAERMQKYCAERGHSLKNVWLGVSVENQEQADARIPLLLQTPAAVRWISAEPLLGPLDLRSCGLWSDMNGRIAPTPPFKCGLDWIVVGGESGYGARPFHLDWARDIVAQCRVAHDGVPVFVKQLGSYPVYDGAHAARFHLDNKKGGDMNEWPIDLRVREFPR